MKLCYEYKLQKTAYVPDGEKLVPVGVFEEHERNGDTCRMVVKILPGVPQKLIDLLNENPTVLQMREVKLKANTCILVPEGSDIIS